MSIYTTGRLDISATLLSQLHHGAGKSGNTQLLRTERRFHPITGEWYDLPVVSGNSIKHMIRDATVRHAIECMDLPDESLSASVIRLLFAGGGLDGGGNSVSLDRARDVARLFPGLSLCGYGAGNTMTNSKLRVHKLELVCRENAWAQRPDSRALPAASQSGLEFRAQLEFDTRHEPTRQSHVSRYLALVDRRLIEADLTERHEAKASRKGKAIAKSDKPATAQMIYDFEVVCAGAAFEGAIIFRECTPLELDALQTGLSYACEGMHDDAYVYTLGAKGNIGHGRAAMRFSGHLMRVVAPTSVASDALLPVPVDEARRHLGETPYAQHLRAHRDEIVSLLERVAA